MDDFLTKVKAKMAEREVSVSQLARDSGLTRPYLSRLLGGHQDPSLKVAGIVAAALGLKLTTEDSQ